MKYDPKKSTLCLPEGDYPACISAVEEKTSSSGNPMEVVTIEVFPSGRESTKLKEYFVEGQDFAAYKYRKLAEAIGKGDEFKAGKFQAADNIGENFTVTLAVEDSDKYGEQNKIKGYGPKSGAAVKPTPSKPKAAAQQIKDAAPVTEEDIPF